MSEQFVEATRTFTGGATVHLYFHCQGYIGLQTCLLHLHLYEGQGSLIYATRDHWDHQCVTFMAQSSKGFVKQRNPSSQITDDLAKVGRPPKLLRQCC